MVSEAFEVKGSEIGVREGRTEEAVVPHWDMMRARQMC